MSSFSDVRGNSKSSKKEHLSDVFADDVKTDHVKGKKPKNKNNIKHTEEAELEKPINGLYIFHFSLFYIDISDMKSDAQRLLSQIKWCLNTVRVPKAGMRSQPAKLSKIISGGA